MRERFHQLCHGVWSGEIEDDAFNALVLTAGFEPREVSIILAYAKYLRQARIPFSQSYMREAIGKHPVIARLLIELFLARFDPEVGDQEGAAAAAEIEQRIEAELDSVGNPDEDRILRRFLNVIRASLRTNYFQRDADGRPKRYLATKIDSGQIEQLPQPVPYREIHVHSPRMEGIHLRGGPVARGGIRWSDRREDFRTEVLGLMKAQMVKNAVIVPVGSKGGFVVRRPPEGDREALLAEVRGVLPGADSRPARPDRHPRGRRGRAAAQPAPARRRRSVPGRRRRQGHGHLLRHRQRDRRRSTASGSTTPSPPAARRATTTRRWGSPRAAPGKSVKRHFREIGIDIQNEEFTVVGVGDMSGDVFGNGMLLSRKTSSCWRRSTTSTCFVDPDPDPAKSASPSASACSGSRARAGTITTAQGKISPGGGIYRAQGEVDLDRLRRDAARLLGHRGPRSGLTLPS